MAKILKLMRRAICLYLPKYFQILFCDNNQYAQIKNKPEVSHQSISSSISPKKLSRKPYVFNSKELFEIINREVQYEHNLISNRMTWYVTSQSFLIAAFFVSRANGHPYQKFAAILIPVLGILCSAIISMSLLAAIAAMDRLRNYEHEQIFKRDKKLQQIVPLNSRFKPEENNDDVKFFKDVGWIHEFGLLPPKLIPLIFILAWIIILVYSLYSLIFLKDHSLVCK